MILAGDVGGTKTNLAQFEPLGGGGVSPPQAEESLPCARFPSLEALLADYRSRHPSPLEGVCLGIAGAVIGGRAVPANLPWSVDARSLAQALGVARVALLNDLVATGYGVEALTAEDLVAIQPGEPTPEANAAILAPGTGLGESILVRVEGHYLPVPSEAGHADFAPRTDAELKVFRALRTRHGRVSYERILSGPGLASVGEIVHAGRGAQAAWSRHVADAPGTTLPAAVSRRAIEQSCDACVETLALFIGILGAEAGNLALRALALSGIYVGGGIAPKILPALKSPAFAAAFRDKDHLRDLLASIPIWVIRNERTAVLGAARHAAAALK